MPESIINYLDYYMIFNHQALMFVFDVHYFNVTDVDTLQLNRIENIFMPIGFNELSLSSVKVREGSLNYRKIISSSFDDCCARRR